MSFCILIRFIFIILHSLLETQDFRHQMNRKVGGEWKHKEF